MSDVWFIIIRYLYSVPKPEDLPNEMSPEMDHSNVSNFFGSDDSSGN